MPDATMQAELARHVQEQAARENAIREQAARRIIGNPWDVAELKTTNELELACRALRHI